MEILIAEDNPSFRLILEALVRKWNFRPTVVTNGKEAWRVLQGDHPPRMAILDWMMPGYTGIEVCRMLREDNREPYVYTLLLTARGGQGKLVEGMEAGADDYLIKPVDSHELRVRLRAGQRIVELQSELVKTRDAIHQQAMRDSLTGLWNRAAIFDLLNRELVRSGRESAPLSVLMIDLDHFKRVNDRFGHLTGDEVLREMAQRMTGSVRAYDAVGRYGGEEFVIVLPNSDRLSAMSQAERVRRAIGALPFLTSEGPLDVTCCVGVYSTEGHSHSTPETAMREADAALYAAKRNGRNRVEVGASELVLA